MSQPERREAALLNTELRNFTRLSEVLEPAKVLELANDFFSLVAMAVTANRGKVLSVQNDMLLSAFSAADRREFCERAYKASLDIRREFGPMADEWKSSYGLPAAAASAMHVGEAVFGMAGPIGNQQFVGFGDCVSICDRLVHRARNGEIVFSGEFMKGMGASARDLSANELPALELARRPAIAIYGLPLETRLDFTSFPAIVMPSTRIEPHERPLRTSTSEPIAAMLPNMSFRLPAMVISSTGKRISPPSTQ